MNNKLILILIFLVLTIVACKDEYTKEEIDKTPELYHKSEQCKLRFFAQLDETAIKEVKKMKEEGGDIHDKIMRKCRNKKFLKNLKEKI